MSAQDRHDSRRWVEKRHPDATGRRKSELIMAYGTGFDHGLAEAQEIVADTMAELGASPEAVARMREGAKELLP